MNHILIYNSVVAKLPEMVANRSQSWVPRIIPCEVHLILMYTACSSSLHLKPESKICSIKTHQLTTTNETTRILVLNLQCHPNLAAKESLGRNSRK